MRIVLNKAQRDYVTRKVAEWIAAGDVIEEHTELCFDAACRTVLMGMMVGKSIEESCAAYHAALKAQETMDPKEFHRIKRMLDRAKRRMA